MGFASAKVEPMHLSDHIKQNRGAGVEISTALGIAPSYLSQIASGHRPAPPAMCVQIERATSGAVMRWDLRPDDWHRIWPELVNQPGAPEVVEPA